VADFSLRFQASTARRRLNLLLVSCGTLAALRAAEETAEPTANSTATPSAPTPFQATDDLQLAKVGWFQVADHGSGEAFTLFVGRLDGRVFEAVTTTSAILGAGPKDGRVLAWWRDHGESIVALYDTADGSGRELLRTADDVDAAAFGTEYDWYWVALKDGGGEVLGLWHSPLDEGPRERIADGWPSRGTYAPLGRRSGRGLVHHG
jgi:hypothetical protein